MKRVLLVNTNTLRSPYPVPPLGLCLLASALEGLYEVRIHDGLAQGAGDSLAASVRDFEPHYIGLGIRNVDDPTVEGGTFYGEAAVRDFVQPLRLLTAAPLILGGSGFTVFPREFMETSGADYGVAGEGETALPALLQALDRGLDPSGMPGVLSKRSPSGGRMAEPSVEMGTLPFSEIDRRLDYGPYRERGSYPIQTKRGCAHRCVYCSYPGLEGRTFRARSPEAVAEEIQQARQRLGDVSVEFVDSTFNDPQGHAEAICSEIARRKPQVRLRTMGVNPARVSEELLRGMKQAGFAQIDVTPDSASPRVLRGMQKNFRLEDLQRTARLVREHRLPTMWFMLLGGPGETEETLRETFDFIDRHVNPEDMVHISEGIRIYPGTPLRGIALQEGVLRESDSLFRPVFYVSPALGRRRLGEWLARAVETRPNCVRSRESTPSPEMLREAAKLRAERNLTEPMFRTLLRLRRSGMR